ncbi:MAG: ABC transporter ATP-binding protein/permease [Treponema sp.]|nr:ABC transporter ATP-binding protein/permease [Treponema sp.]
MFEKIRYRNQVVKNLLPFAYGVKRFFFINLLLSLIVMGLSLINPQFYKMFINEVILNRRFNKIAVVVTGYIGIFFCNAILGYIKIYANNRLLNRVLFRAKYKIWRGNFKLDFPEYEKISIGDMKMRLEDDTAQIGSFAGRQTVDYLISFLTVVVSSAMLFLIDWRLAIFSITAIPLTFWMDHKLSKKENVLNNSNRENDQAMSSWLHASVRGWREIKALNLYHYQRKQFFRYIHNYALYFGKWINYWVSRVLIIPRIKDKFFMQFGLYFLGGLLIINHMMNIGDLLIFALYHGMLSDSVNSVSSADAELQAFKSITDRLLAELNKEIPVSVNKPARVSFSGNELISFNNICFSYPETNVEIFHDFSLKINAGERVAITGKSGCGKTTLIKLMAGMLKPRQGTILIGGVNLENADLSLIHGRIGFIMQESFLFNATIRENLLYGKQNATGDELIDACRKAYIYDFINTLPEGFETFIGEKGIKLSGGQRQRLVLARLFLRDVDLFIFDEATSSLDQRSEGFIQEAISNISVGKTVIIVAHRKSVIDFCERTINL